VGAGLKAPGIGVVARVAPCRRINPYRSRRRRIAHGEDDGVNAFNRAAGVLKTPSSAVARQSDRRVRDKRKAPFVPVGRLGEKVLKVEAVVAATGEAWDVIGVPRRQPSREMSGIIRPSAHIGGADIQQMVRIGRGICGALGEVGGLLDQLHAHRSRPRQMQGCHQAAEAAAHDGDDGEVEGGHL
jgi:hypothetical protein